MTVPSALEGPVLLRSPGPTLERRAGQGSTVLGVVGGVVATSFNRKVKSTGAASAAIGLRFRQMPNSRNFDDAKTRRLPLGRPSKRSPLCQRP